MPNIENDEDLDKIYDNGDAGGQPSKKKLKKILLIAIPLFIVLGSAVGFFFFFQPDLKHEVKPTVQVVKKSDEKEQVFYDFPKMNIQIKGENEEIQILKLQFSIELTSVDDIPAISGLSGSITDAVLAHTMELSPDEVGGINGLYWLKEELLYRINLITDPIKVTSINVKTFEFQKKDN